MMNAKYQHCAGRNAHKIFLPTPADIEGPYYVPGAPFKTALTGKPLTRADVIRPLHLHGKVFDTQGKLLPGAVLDFWQADKDGDYDMTGFNYRGKVQADASGSYTLDTIVPGAYLMAPNEYRCAHVHVKVSAAGYEPLTTQLYFEDDQYDATDPWFNPQMIIGVPDGLFNFVLGEDV